MSHQPYIPLYIGDWEQDTNCLTPLAEFALLKLTFKLFNAEKRGVFFANFRTLFMLFKSKNIEETKEVFQELIDNNVLNITELSDGRFEIISRRMIRESNISEVRRQAGRSGGRGKSKSGSNGDKKQNESKTKAKHKQITDNDNEYNNVIQLDIQENKGVDFETFWEVYGKKVGDKKHCKKIWDKLKPDVQKFILDSLPQWLKQFSNIQYQPYPETYLNQERWNDELKLTGKINNSGPNPNYQPKQVY